MSRVLKFLIGFFQRPEPAAPTLAGESQPLSRMTRIGLLGAHIGQTGGLWGKTR